MKKIMMMVIEALMIFALGCARNTDAEVVSFDEMDALFGIEDKVYVWQEYGYHGLFQISFNSDYTYEYCVGGCDAEVISGSWTIDEYRILTMRDDSSADGNGCVNCFEVCPCIEEGEFSLKYLPDASEGFLHITDVAGYFYHLYEYDYPELENVLGQTPLYAYYEGTTPTFGVYYLDEGNTRLEVWGTEPSEVVFIDLDNDEKTEMIASVVWGDGVEDVLVYKATEDGIIKAYGSSLLTDEHEMGYAWAVMAQYVTETNQIVVLYIPVGETEYNYIYYDMNLDALEWKLNNG